MEKNDLKERALIGKKDKRQRFNLRIMDVVMNEQELLKKKKQ